MGKDKILVLNKGKEFTNTAGETTNCEFTLNKGAMKEEKTPVNGIKGTVMTSKLMGSFSLVHLSVLNNNKEIIHVHSQMPSNFLPKESTAVAIKINTNKIFIFPKNI